MKVCLAPEEVNGKKCGGLNGMLELLGTLPRAGSDCVCGIKHQDYPAVSELSWRAGGQLKKESANGVSVSLIIAGDAPRSPGPCLLPTVFMCSYPAASELLPAEPATFGCPSLCFARIPRPKLGPATHGRERPAWPATSTLMSLETVQKLARSDTRSCVRSPARERSLVFGWCATSRTEQNAAVDVCAHHKQAAS
jgi:hypothetical protein